MRVMVVICEKSRCTQQALDWLQGWFCPHPFPFHLSQDIFRRYPNQYESIIATLCDNLDRWAKGRGMRREQTSGASRACEYTRRTRPLAVASLVKSRFSTFTPA